MYDPFNSPSINPIAVTNADIQELLQYFSKNTYWAGCNEHPVVKSALDKSLGLLELDYNVLFIGNESGELSVHYPGQIAILESELMHHPSNNTIYERSYDAIKLKELICKARKARCRARFPIPVILYKGKYICRSATLSGGPEIYGRHGLDYLFSNTETANPVNAEPNPPPPTQSDWQLFDKVRSQDIKLLKTFNVGTIVDFMVEKKKVKFGVNVTSSEKVDKENRYSEFTIISLPYPGCEFFKEFRDNEYTAEGLIFDWSPSHVDASISVPPDPIINQLQIDWNSYKEWDLVKITQKYMRLLLRYIQESSSGLLLHCISGWDRTPLFVSLIRLSLWADGLIHRDFDLQQILYLTIAYDWMLFGHHLTDRIEKGEEIFIFCFYMLKYIADDEFSITSRARGRLDRGNDRSSDRSGRSDQSWDRLSGRSGDRFSTRSSDRSFDQCDFAPERNSNHTGSSYERCSELDISDEGKRFDSELQLDNVMFEQDGRGSSISISSISSCASNKSHNQSHNLTDELNNGNGLPQDSTRNNIFTGYDSNNLIEDGGNSTFNEEGNNGLTAEASDISLTQSSTSPVMVPYFIPSSDSSVGSGSGSWQLVTTATNTGSLRNLCTVSVPNSDGSRTEPNSSQESNSTMTDIEVLPDLSTMSRRERLTELRGLFYHSYYSGIGFKFKNETSFKYLFGSFAQKMGLSPNV